MTGYETTVAEIEAELAAVSSSDLATLAQLLLRLGPNLEAVGQRARAVTTLERAIALFEELGDIVGALQARNALGSVFINLDRLDDARRILETVLWASMTQASIRATTLNNLGIVDEMTGQLESAGRRYMRAIEILRRLEATDRLATTLNNLGIVYQSAAGSPTRARHGGRRCRCTGRSAPTTASRAR